MTEPTRQFIPYKQEDVDSIAAITQAHGVLHCKLTDTNEPATEMIFRYLRTAEHAPAGDYHEDEVIVNLWWFGRHKMESEGSHGAACQAPKLRGLWWLPTWSGRDVPFSLDIFILWKPIEGFIYKALWELYTVQSSGPLERHKPSLSRTPPFDGTQWISCLRDSLICCLSRIPFGSSASTRTCSLVSL